MKLLQRFRVNLFTRKTKAQILKLYFKNILLHTPDGKE